MNLMDYRWAASNTKVVAVDENGKVIETVVETYDFVLASFIARVRNKANKLRRCTQCNLVSRTTNLSEVYLCRKCEYKNLDSQPIPKTQVIVEESIEPIKESTTYFKL